MLVGVGIIGIGFVPTESQTENVRTVVRGEVREEVHSTARSFSSALFETAEARPLAPAKIETMKSVAEVKPKSTLTTVPFYSQFTDISAPEWRGVGCGIASLAMIIEYYTDETVNVDALLAKGVANNAFLKDAGWTHGGLIALSNRYGLGGESVSVAHLNMNDAFDALTKEVEEGPVMVSVHYTFEPTNPIPHLVVIADIKDGKVFYNDPAEKGGGGSISVEKFERAWKKRYISIRPQ